VEIDVVVVVGAIELALGDGHSNEPRRGIENGFSLDASSAIFSDQASGFHPKLSARMWALLSDTLSFPIGGQRPVGIDGGHLWHDQCGEMLGQGWAFPWDGIDRLPVPGDGCCGGPLFDVVGPDNIVGGMLGWGVNWGTIYGKILLPKTLFALDGFGHPIDVGFVGLDQIIGSVVGVGTWIVWLDRIWCWIHNSILQLGW